MASVALQKNIGAYIAPKRGISPAAAAASTINGPAHDRTGKLSAALHAMVGATTGSPTSFTVDAKLQDSADGSTGWADITGAAIATIVAADSNGIVNVDLTSARKFVRAVVTVAFVGGTTPTVGVGAGVLLGGADVLAAV